MSRYLEMMVDGTLESVADRAFRAFKSIGRVEEHDPRSYVEGTIRVEGVPAFVTVEWLPRGERVRLDIAASSDDTLNRAADVAMYRFAHAYKETNWFAGPVRQRAFTPAQMIGLGVFGLILALIAGALVLSGQR